MKPISTAQFASAWLLAGAMICSGGCGHATKVQDTPAERERNGDPPSAAKEERRRPKHDAPPSRSGGEANRNEVPVAPSPAQLLAEGSVRDMQQKLQEKGMLPAGQNNITGKWDSRTENALRKFQAQNDLPATGFPDRASAKALGLDPDELFKRQDEKAESQQEKRQEAQEEKKEEKKEQKAEAKEEAKEDAKENAKEQRREKENRGEAKQEKREAKKAKASEGKNKRADQGQ